MKNLKYAVSLTIAAALLVVNARADDAKALNPYFVILSRATAVELPAKAAELVSKADAKQRIQTTLDVVRAAVPLSPASAPSIVGSIAESSPEMAATAAATAVSLMPDLSAAIARAAAVAAPGKAGQIVEAMCRVVPEDYKEIAIAVADVVPGAGKEIYAAISTAIPALKDSLKQILAGYNGNIPSVPVVIESLKPIQVATALTPTLLPQSTFSSPSLAPPVVKPPYVPLPVSINNINPGSGGQVPVGGRNYASP